MNDKEKREYDLTVPSELIRFALEALEEAEANPTIIPQMSIFRSLNRTEDACFACLGGAAYLKREGLIGLDSEGLALNALKIHSKTTTMGCALDEFRVGFVEAGLIKMGFRLPRGMKPQREIDHYVDDPIEFKVGLNRLADELESAGL